MYSNNNFDACIFGGGVTGLLAAERLVSLGFKVIVIEQKNQIASGSSTRNQGWLHYGTYHCNSISNFAQAIRVAQRCIHGHEYIKSYAPEVIENPHLPTYALINKESSVKRSIKTWEQAHVPYIEVSKSQVINNIPAIKEDAFIKAFHVNDVCINVRMLYKKLLFDIHRKGGIVSRNTCSRFINKTSVIITDFNGNQEIVNASIYIHATGVDTKRVFQNEFDIELPIRFWRSHLLRIDKLSDHVCFFVDPGEVTVMRHNDNNIVGLNDDARISQSYNFNLVDIKSKQEIIAALEKRFFFKEINNRYSLYSCVKVDLYNNINDSRSLEIFINEPIENHLCIFPGKMTTAPFLADKIARIVFERLDDNSVAYRPWDY